MAEVSNLSVLESECLLDNDKTHDLCIFNTLSEHCEGDFVNQSLNTVCADGQ